MQLITLMGQMLESGKITLSTKNKEDIEITAINKHININAKNKEFIKDIMAAVREGNRRIDVKDTIKESPEVVRNAKGMRDILIDVAEELTDTGITITLSYKGEVIATMGAQANSKLSRLLTGTKAIEINNLAKIIEIGIKTI